MTAKGDNAQSLRAIQVADVGPFVPVKDDAVFRPLMEIAGTLSSVGFGHA